MNHKKVDIKFALDGCRICAGAILMKYERLEDLIRLKLEEITNG